MEKQENIWSE